jgi:PAS domain S-box-containing protein
MSGHEPTLSQRLRYHVENSPLAVIEWDERLCVQYWSKQAERIFGYPAYEVLGRDAQSLGIVFHDDADDSARVTERLRAGREARNVSASRNVRKDGTVIHCEWYNSALRDERGQVVSILSLVHDVTEQRRYEEERRRAELEAKIVTDAGITLVGAALDFKTRARTVVHLALPAFADWSQLDTIDDDGAIRTVAFAHREPHREEAVRAFLDQVNFDPSGRLAIPFAIRTGDPVVCPVFADSRAIISLADRQTLMYRDVAGDASTAIVVPLRARGAYFGTLTFGRDEAERRFSETDLPLARELAVLAALALDNARLYEREHRVADTLQRAMLPSSLPRVDGFLFDSAYSPAAAESEVGGDWYDAFMLSDGRIAVSIGDVTGHGLRAAATMSEVRQSIRASALAEESPLSVLERAHRLLCLNEEPTIVTAVFGIIDPRERTFWYATAGHPAPLVADASGVRALEAGGLPLGVRSVEASQSFRVVLEAGSLLVLYTDGLIEFDRDVIRGEAALRNVVWGEWQRPSEHPARAIKDRVLLHQHQSDDIAILTVRLQPVPLQARWVVQRGDAIGAHALRREISRTLQTFANADSDMPAAEVAVGEILANAVEHAPSDVAIDLDWRSRAARLTIGDLGPGVAQAARLPDPYSERGRGLYLIAHLCLAFDVSTDPQGVTTARVTLPVFRDVRTLSATQR